MSCKISQWEKKETIKTIMRENTKSLIVVPLKGLTNRRDFRRRKWRRTRLHTATRLVACARLPFSRRASVKERETTKSDDFACAWERDPREMSKPLSSPRTRLYVYARIYIMYVSSPRLRIISKSERLTCGRAASLFLARLRRTVRSFRFLRDNESSMEIQELEGTERPSSRYDSFERKPDIHLEILICFPWLFFTGVYNLSQLYMNKWK